MRSKRWYIICNKAPGGSAKQVPGYLSWQGHPIKTHGFAPIADAATRLATIRRNVMTCPTSLNRFCIQLNEFCLMFQEEILRVQITPGKTPSAEVALGFAESLILCPTAEAARACIGRDLAGARSLLAAADAVLRWVRSERFDIAPEEPQYQTKFYLLACVIQDFLRTCRERALEGIEPICSGL